MKARYPKDSYQRSYDSSLHPLWRPDLGITPDEDGDHYSSERDFFEWWYFDASFDNGYRLVAILHSSLYNAVDHLPTVDIRITPPGMPSVAAIGRFRRSDFEASPDICDLKIAGCRAKALDPGRYHLVIEQGSVSGELYFDGIAPGWRPGNGYLFFDEASGHYFRWVVPLPAARVSGELSLAGQKVEARGYGYHDHNWGNFLLGDAFSHWYWGRFFVMSGGALWVSIFGDVVGRGHDPARVQPFLLVRDNQIVSQRPQLTFQSEVLRRENITGIQYPTCLKLSIEETDYQAELTLKSKRTLETVNFAQPRFRPTLYRQVSEIAFYLSLGKPVLGPLISRLIGKGAYLRLQAEAGLRIHGNPEANLTGEAIYEIMQFSPT
jgi:predicted secreted hydrolase